MGCWAPVVVRAPYPMAQTGFGAQSLVLSLQGVVLMVGGTPHHLLSREGSSQKGKAASTGKAW